MDLGCGQGVLARRLPEGVDYVGVDASAALIQKARGYDPSPHHRYVHADATCPFKIPHGANNTQRDHTFTHAAFVLSLQNMKDQAAAIGQASKHLVPGGKLVVVLNHPCYRIPRQSRWDVDQQNRLQYRRVDRYKSPLEIPIVTHPGGADQGATTCSYHHPLESYFKWLHQAGLASELVEEWYSDKTSEGSNTMTKAENRARSEFPLFLAISAFKTAG